MLILCRHIQVYTLGRLSIDGFSFERVAQFNLEWIFSKLDSGFQSLVGFRILIAGFRIPKPVIQAVDCLNDCTNPNFFYFKALIYTGSFSKIKYSHVIF